MDELEPMRYAGEDQVPDWVPDRCARCPGHRWAGIFRMIVPDGAIIADSIDGALDSRCPGAVLVERSSHGIKLPNEYDCQHPGVLDGSLGPCLDVYFAEAQTAMAIERAARGAELIANSFSRDL